MLMKKVAVTFAALVAAVSAHAQLSSETTTGTVITSTPSTYDVSFNLSDGSYPIYSGGGGLGFKLIDAADVTFSGGTSTAFSFGSLSGSSLSTPLAFYFTSGVGTKTVDLSAGTYTYTALGAALFSTAKLYVDVNAVSAVPEPQTYGMLLAGLAVIGVSVRRRRMPVVSRSVAMSC
jgi:hypothetical protein